MIKTWVHHLLQIYANGHCLTYQQHTSEIFSRNSCVYPLWD